MTNNIYDEKYQSNFPNSHYLANLNNLNATNQSIHLNRLPTLGEILANKSKSPVDLLTFYQFMKEVEGQVDYLDFWFDLVNHLNLCKHYVKGLRDSIVRQSQIYGAPKDREISGASKTTAPTSGFRDSVAVSEMSKRKSLSSSILLELIINDNILEDSDSPRLSAFLRGDINLNNADPKISELIKQYNAEVGLSESECEPSPVLLSSSQKSSPSLSGNQRFPNPNQQIGRRVDSKSHLINDGEDAGDTFSDSFYPTQVDIKQADRAVSPSQYISMQQQGSSSQTRGPPVVSPFGDSQQEQQEQQEQQQQYPKLAHITPNLLERLIKDVPIEGNNFISRDRLRESSHNLLLKYFMPDSEKNLNLPDRLNTSIINDIEVEERDDPEVFNYVKNYVFNKIENEHLPKFLDCMATRNINHSEFWRIIIGFFFIFIGFWISYIFIFLDYRKGIRPVIVLPYLVGFYLIISSIYLIDPILAWFGFSEGFSEATQRRIIKIKEKFIYKFILKRSYWVLFLILVATAILTVLFSIVPGHRL